MIRTFTQCEGCGDVHPRPGKSGKPRSARDFGFRRMQVGQAFADFCPDCRHGHAGIPPMLTRRELDDRFAAIVVGSVHEG